MKVLYISHDGITDHIGKSQVAPYLLGLAAKRYQITVLSNEKNLTSDEIKEYKTLFNDSGPLKDEFKNGDIHKE